MQATDATQEPAPTAEPEILDIRGMASPANVLAVLNRASTLPKGVSFEIRSDCNPYQLYDLLQQRGFALMMARQADGTYLGKIAPRDSNG
jgi:hypothetical protein